MEVWPGSPYPLGASYDGAGTNFSLFSEIAEGVELCLFDDEGSETRLEITEKDALIWHASSANTSENPRRGFVPRYVAGGTQWLGALRFPYNYSDEELELRPGDPIGGPHFPTLETAF